MTEHLTATSLLRNGYDAIRRTLAEREAENSRLKSILREERDRHRQKNHGGSSDDRCNVCQRLDIVGEATQTERVGSIETPCPSCGSRNLYLDQQGHLRCPFTDCQQPHVEDAIAALRASLKTAHEKEADTEFLRRQWQTRAEFAEAQVKTAEQERDEQAEMLKRVLDVAEQHSDKLSTLLVARDRLIEQWRKDASHLHSATSNGYNNGRYDGVLKCADELASLGSPDPA